MTNYHSPNCNVALGFSSGEICNCQPWIAKASEIYCETTGKTVAVIPGVRCDEPTPGIARLIAAAPDLLAACQAMLRDNHELGAISRPVANDARAAIAKATDL